MYIYFLLKSIYTYSSGQEKSIYTYSPLQESMDWYCLGMCVHFNEYAYILP